MHRTLALGVRERILGVFQGTGSYDGAPGWEEPLKPSRPAP